MGNRITLSSDHVDRHGDLFTKEALESGAKIINGTRKVRIGIEHKRDLPPYGKIVDARVEEREGHNYLTALQIEYDQYEEVAWDKDLIKASCSIDSSPFNEPDFEVPIQLEIRVDRQNFKSRLDYESYLSFLRESKLELKAGEFGRKSVVNDPEIILKLASSYLIYKLLKPTITKTFDKISDRASDDAASLYDFIKKSIKEMLNKAVPKNRPVNYVIKISGNPEIELFARVTDAEHLVKALRESKLIQLRKEINKVEENVCFEKIQYTLTDKGKFNFLLTKNGETIGRRISFKKRDKKLELINSKLLRSKN